MYIIYVLYNIHVYYICNNTLQLAHEISRHFWAAYGQPIKTLNDKFSLVRKHRSSNQEP